jgi:hypothetical protein
MSSRRSRPRARARPAVVPPAVVESPPSPPPKSLPQNRLQIDPYVFILLLVPFFVLWRNSNLVFTPVGTIDPWVYYGFFRNLVSFKRDLFPGTYYGSRLSWILPGYILNKLLSPLAANYVLHLSVYYLALLSIFSLLKTATNRQSALLGALLFGFYPYSWMALGWDYVDGAGIAFFLLTLVLLTRAATADRRYGSLIGGGVACAALIYSNLAWGLLCPIFVFYYVLLSRARRSAGLFKTLLEMAIFFGIGIAVVTAVFALINHAIDGTYWFYAPSLGYALAAARRPNPWKISIAKWMVSALWLILPAATALMSVIVGAFQRKDLFTRQHLIRILFVMQFFVAAGVLLVEDFRGDPVLQFSYYASYLIPFMFLAVGSQFLRIPHLTDRGFPAIVVFALFALCLPWALSDGFWAKIHGPLWPLGVVLLMTCAGAVLFGRLPGLIVILTSSGILYSYLLAGQAAKPGNAGRGSFVRIAHDIQEIEKVRQGRPIRFWYDAAEPFGFEFYSLNATYLWGYTMVSATFPEVPKDLPWPPNTLLVVPSSRRDAADMALKPNRFDGEVLTLESQSTVDAEGGRYTLAFFGVHGNP